MSALRLLLVEDDPIDRRLFEELLREAAVEGCELRTAERVALAVQLLREGHYDLVLTDLSLPDGYGRQTVETLRQAAPGTPIVVLTGSEHPDLSQTFSALNIDIYVPKQGLTPQTLVETIRRAVPGWGAP